MLLAMMVALHAFSIDAMLPALGDMGVDLGISNENHRQAIITSLFLGFSAGVLVYGFISDNVGRRSPVIAGFLIFLLASIICTFSTTFAMLLLGRILQGVGSAGPYVIAVAIVRDRYQGRDMAEIMSLIMMVFIGIPMIAPFIGQVFQQLAGWRSIFVALTTFAVITLAWFYLRQPETLDRDQRKKLTVPGTFKTVIEIFSERVTRTYIIVLALISGAFITYLSTAQQVFHDMYGIGEKLPLAIATLASMYGLACFANARLVQKLGMRKLIRFGLWVVVASSLLCTLKITISGDNLKLFEFLLYMAVVVFSFGFLFENVVTLALDPMDHIAGAAMSVITASSTLIAVMISAVLGSLLDKTVLPVVLGFAILCLLGQWLHKQTGDKLKENSLS